VTGGRPRTATGTYGAVYVMRNVDRCVAEIRGWSRQYDPARAARELIEDDSALLLGVIEETKALAETVARERAQLRPSTG